MGNSISPCFHPKTLKSKSNQTSSSSAKLVFWEGTTRFLGGTHMAGEIMLEFPEKMVCHAGSFFIGQPVPAMAIDDELYGGETYLVLPLDSFACRMLSASSLAALAHKSPVKFGGNPFQYLKDTSGRVVIKVTPEFITKLICGNSPAGGYLCSTPELQKHYDRLVGTREQLWSPKLATISEYKPKFSPCKYIRVGVQQEGDYHSY